MMNKLFFALELPPQDKATIVRWRDLAFGVFAKPVPAANLHLTLCFLGDISLQQEQQLITLADLLQAEVINMEFSLLGVFSRSRVLYIAPSDDVLPAIQLASKLKKLASKLAIDVDTRKLKPHITLFRKVNRLPELQQLPVFQIQFCNLVLYRSTPGPKGVTYHEVSSWSMKAPSNE